MENLDSLLWEDFVLEKLNGQDPLQDFKDMGDIEKRSPLLFESWTYYKKKKESELRRLGKKLQENFNYVI